MEAILITCTKCLASKDSSEFYSHCKGRHKRMSKCKECHKRYVIEYQRKNADKMRTIYKERINNPRRREQNKQYYAAMKARCPERFRAYSLFHSARKCGRITPSPCEVCGSTRRIEGHHEDYSKPLEVRWLCKAHHLQLHAKWWRHEFDTLSN